MLVSTGMASSNVDIARDHLDVALRRIRLEATLAVAQHNEADAKHQASIAQQLTDALRREHELRNQHGSTLPIAQLSQRLALTATDESILLLAIGLEIDPVLAIALSALGGEEPRGGITGKLVAQVLRFTGVEAMQSGLSSAHPLCAAEILESQASAGMPETLRSWRVGARVVGYLCGDREVDPLLVRAGGVVAVPAELDLEHVAAARALVTRALESGDQLVLLLEGADGVGRRTLVAEVAARHGREVIAVDAGRLSPDRPRLVAELRALRRECWLRDAIPMIARLDTFARRDAAGDRIAEIAAVLESPTAGIVVVSAASGAELPELERRVVRIRIESPGARARARIWTCALDLLGYPMSPAIDAAVHGFALTPGGIYRAAANVRMLAGKRALEPADIRAGVAAEIQERFSGLATRVQASQTWDDLVLSRETLDDIRAFIARSMHAHLVYDQWGFRDKLQRGLGLSALFSGPPGTGKTMVAGLIAASLGLELYMVDLSQIVSKWVGETEKQLGKIFDVAGMGHVALLFDEADALFAKRTEVKSSNDRYANLEVNYLLTRIETFTGIAILTTNLEASVDVAFRRRFAADIRFYPPERDERIRLWQALLPASAPRAGHLDLTKLADAYPDMCGGHIRNSVLRAAFLAADEQGPVTQDRLTRAAATEYRAMGKVLGS